MDADDLATLLTILVVCLLISVGVGLMGSLLSPLTEVLPR